MSPDEPTAPFPKAHIFWLYETAQAIQPTPTPTPTLLDPAAESSVPTSQTWSNRQSDSITSSFATRTYTTTKALRTETIRLPTQERGEA